MAVLAAVVSLAFGPQLELQLGSHGLLEVRDVALERLNSTADVLASMLAAVKAGGLTLVGEPMMQHFPVMGVSGILLLSESHISVHTWPEHGYAAIDLFTCGVPAPALCGPSEAGIAHFDSSDEAWRCNDGSVVDAAGAGGLWAAAAFAVAGLRAGAATFLLVDRGVPLRRVGGRRREPAHTFGWLGGLETGDSQREL
jgi:S-adenosylmethionine decarboxylase